MTKTTIRLSLFVAGLAACLSIETAQARIAEGATGHSNKKLYHERKESQVEELFRKLPSIEQEIDSVFDNASFFSSFEPSPPANKNSNKDVEDLFRRILLSEKEVVDQGRNLSSFLGDFLEDNGIVGMKNNFPSYQDSPSNGNVMVQPISEVPMDLTDQSKVGATSVVEEVHQFKNFYNDVHEPIVHSNVDEPIVYSNVDEPIVPNIANVNKPNVAITTPAQNVGAYKFKFPTIQHTVYSGPIHVKAHSSVDLSPMDSEIFLVVQSIMTPYLQQRLGDTLNAYNLEIDYSLAHDKSVRSSDVVTSMEVTCAFKVVSDSVESFKKTDHDQAYWWIHDFFVGPEKNKLVEALGAENIPVNEITFVGQELFNGQESNLKKNVAEANSQSFGKIFVSKKSSNEKSSGGTALLAISLSVIAVGSFFLLHFTGRLPSKATIKQGGRNVRNSIKEGSVSVRDSVKHRMPSMKLGKKKRGDKKGGQKRRTFSGTFRRHPEGGIRKAAIQKKPAKSEEYLSDSASEAASILSSGYEDPMDDDDYTFSNYGKDYGAPATPSRHSSIPRTPRRNDEEFSMPDDYDSNHETRINTLLKKIETTAAYLTSPGKSNHSQGSIKSPIPSGAPRRVTSDDIASLGDLEDWSIKSYNSGSAHQLYRDAVRDAEMRRPEPPGESPRKKTLSMPFFT